MGRGRVASYADGCQNIAAVLGNFVTGPQWLRYRESNKQKLRPGHLITARAWLNELKGLNDTLNFKFSDLRQSFKTIVEEKSDTWTHPLKEEYWENGRRCKLRV